MNPSSFDRVLAASGKTTLEENPGVKESLLAVTRQAQLQSNRPRRRVPHLVPILAISGLALTGGATAWVTSVQPDVVIPVAYTTDVGQPIECVIYLEVPNPAIREHLSNTDWAGIGSRIYDRALAATLEPGDGQTFNSEQDRDSWSWFTAAGELTTGNIPVDLLPENDVVAASDSSCTGDLH